VDLKTISVGEVIHLSPSIYSRGAEAFSWRNHRVDWKRQHEIWDHGNSLISAISPSQQDLEAGIIQLQRAVESRDKLLDQVYGFEKIPGRKQTNKYEIMAALGIIRPTLKIRLRELRNSLIHNPTNSLITQQECELLSDTSWYYLKVTDRIAQQCTDEMTMQMPSSGREGSSLSLTLETNTWEAAADGYVAPEIVLDAPVSGCVSIVITNCEFVKYSGYLKFKGNAVGTDAALWKLIQIFFDESIT
jgi:hypothetical protein